MKKIAKRAPLVHMAKRDAIPFWKAWLIRLLALLAALLCCALVIRLLTGLDPIKVYEAMAKGAFGTARRSWITVRDALYLLGVALAITPAFKMKFWNIGAEGQVLMGAAATSAVMIYGGDQLPTPLLFTLMITASVVAGAVWGMIPAVFKAKWKTNETLFTLMFNYIAIQIVSCLVVLWERTDGSNTIGIINRDTEVGWIKPLFGLDYGWNLVLVLGLTVFMFIYLRYSKHGYEIAVVGDSERTARYAGIRVSHVIVRTMALSGAICGLVGFLLVSGSAHTLSTGTAGGRGFTAIIVSWMSKFNPFTMVVISLLLAFLEKGAGQIASQFSLNVAASDVLTGILLFFILGCEFFINYQLKFRIPARRTKGGEAA